MFATGRVLRFLAASACCLAVLAPVLVPSPAQAWWRGGFFVGAPFYYPPPVYYPPPPVYYPPPPVYYAPPPAAYVAPGTAYAAQPGRTCFAGSYTCPLGANVPAGAGCSCPTGRGNAYGRAG